jgi:hypothetical protein
MTINASIVVRFFALKKNINYTKKHNYLDLELKGDVYAFEDLMEVCKK